MPTNKKKGSGSKNKAAPATTKSTKPIDKANNAPAKNPLLLKGPQLTVLILLSIGFSQVMQVRSAFAMEPDGQPVPICVQHLGEAACTNDTILSLLKYKYGTALQLTILVVSIAIKLWKAPDEKDLARFNTLLSLTPLLTGIQAFYACRDTLGSGVLVKQLMMGVVLAILCAPSSLQMLPFYGASKTGVRTKSVPALVLLSLVVWNLFQTVSYLWMTSSLTSNTNSATNEPTIETQWWLPVQASALQSLSLELQAAAKPIIYFLAVDCLTTAALCAYCWQVLSYPSQRSVFFMLAGTKYAEYYYQLPSMKLDPIHAQLYQLEHIKWAALVTAVMAGVGWFFPDLSSLSSTIQDDDAAASDKKTQ